MEENKSEKKTWTDEERLALAEKLDAELEEYISKLEKKEYAEGWPEDRWEEEMEKHPFFMKKAPEPGEELSPLMEGLQQLKYGESDNTPEELANSYKEDGNFNYKHKNYRLAILNYTEGIKSNCSDKDLMAQLYNNRAASHFMIRNYRCSLNDCKRAITLKPDYTKALNRAAYCCFHVKDYDQCIDFCDELFNQSVRDNGIISLRSQAIASRERMKRDKRRQEILEQQLNREEEELLETIKNKGISLELIGEKEKPEIKDLEPQVPQLAQNRVHMDPQNKLIWPVMMLYPETQQTDFIQNFHEDTLLIEELEQLFIEPPDWDIEKRYSARNVNVYFEGKDKRAIYRVNVQDPLIKILQDERFVVRGGTPAFLIFVRSSEAEKRFLEYY